MCSSVSDTLVTTALSTRLALATRVREFKALIVASVSSFMNPSVESVTRLSAFVQIRHLDVIQRIAGDLPPHRVHVHLEKAGGIQTKDTFFRLTCQGQISIVFY